MINTKFFIHMLTCSALVCAAVDAAPKNEYKRRSKRKNAAPPPQKEMVQQKQTDYRGFIQGSYTYWVPSQIGLEAFQLLTDANPITQANAYSGAFVRPRIRPQHGFKASAGVYNNNKNWDLSAEYTWFQNTSDHMRSRVFSGNSAYGSFSGDTVNYGQTQWKNFFQRGNLVLGSAIKGNKFFTACPFVGATGAYEKQRYYYNGTTSSTTDPTVLTGIQTWWGIGPMIGMKGIFQLVKTDHNLFVLIGKGGMGQVYETAELNMKADTNESPRNVIQWTKDTYSSPTPLFDLSLGFGYAYSMNCCALYLNASWEMQQWQNHNHFTALRKEIQGYGDFALHGLTVDAGVTF